MFARCIIYTETIKFEYTPSECFSSEITSYPIGKYEERFYSVLERIFDFRNFENATIVHLLICKLKPQKRFTFEQKPGFSNYFWEIRFNENELKFFLLF